MDTRNRVAVAVACFSAVCLCLIGPWAEPEVFAAETNMPASPNMTEPLEPGIGSAPMVKQTEAAPSGLRVLYAPADLDAPGFRNAIAELVGGPVDYFDARVGIPSISQLTSYDCVFTYPNYGYHDEEIFGDYLAAAVDSGKTTVVLGPFCVPTGINWLGGDIMTAGYSPVMTPTGTNHYMLSGWVGDGVPAFTAGVADFEATYRDELAVQGSGAAYSHFEDGEIAFATRSTDYRVSYVNGATGLEWTIGDWPLLVANACRTGAVDVLVYDEFGDHSYAATGISAISANFSVADRTQFNNFLTSPSRDWDLVVVDAPSNAPDGGWDDLVAWTNSGKPVVMSFWDWENDTVNGHPGLASAFGFTSTTELALDPGDFYDAAPTPGGTYAHAGVPGLPHDEWTTHWGDDGDIFGLAAGTQAVGEIVGQGPVVIQNAAGNAIAAFVIDSWDGPGAVELWRNLALRVWNRTAFDGAALSIEWLYPDENTILEAHPLVVGPITELTEADILSSANHSIDVHGPFIHFEFSGAANWGIAAFNGWNFADLTGELESIMGARFDFIDPGITSVPVDSISFDDDWVRANFSGMQAPADSQIRIEVLFGLFADGFESGDTTRWSGTVEEP